jgi:hypothetical protein
MTQLAATAQPTPLVLSPTRLWIARVLAGIGVLFLAMDSIVKLLQLRPAIEGTMHIGYPPGVVLPLGIVTLAFLILYLVPRTAVLGALLWTAYLGGAVASNVRIGAPLFTHVLAPVYVAAFLWLPLWLRDPRLRALLPLRAGGCAS